MLKKILFFSCQLALIVLIGCGYTFRSNLPSYMENIYVGNFKNKIEFAQDNQNYSSYFPGLENDIIESVEARFMLEGSLNLVDDKQLADIILTGNLLDYIKQPLRYDGDDVEEYRVSVIVDCKVKDSREEEIMWEGKIVGDTTYFVQGTLSKTETEAVDEAVEDLARRIVEKTVVRW